VVDEPGGAEGDPGLVHVRLDVAYDGTDFSGWAAQPGRRTVAGVLTGELSRVLGAVEGLTVAGRTDAGVHATGQVCHVDVPFVAWQRVGPTLVARLAGLLPPDVRVLRAEQTSIDFDARFSALARRYEYRVTDAPYGADPLRARYTLAWPRPLDLSLLQTASDGLTGEHDFAAYCRRKESATTIRAVTRLDWRRGPDGVLVATVQADAFCQAMVRSLIGALLSVGSGARDVAWPASLLGRTERANEVVVAPPHGLTLVAVEYPEPGDYAERTRVTRNRRSVA
jgi:tRNA pseudouridine38-40 synthase